MSPRPLLQLEGAGVLASSLVAYGWSHGSWGLFALLFLVPDISMVGYFGGPRVGAIMYNAVHTYLGPLVLGGFAIRFDHRTALLVSLIWIAHIGVDRMLGYGLKYSTRFKDTHLNADRHAA